MATVHEDSPPELKLKTIQHTQSSKGLSHLLLPKRNLNNPRDYALRQLGELIVGIAICCFVSGFSLSAISGPQLLEKLVGALLLVIPMGIAVCFTVYAMTNSIAILHGNLQQELWVGNRSIWIKERWQPVLSSFQFDALAICRLRIIELPDQTALDSENEPGIWLTFQKHEAGRFALVAENVDGRRLHSLVVAYPLPVVEEAAGAIKQLLDRERALHHRQLADENPNFQPPDSGAGIPICRGARLREPARKPPRSASALATLSRIDGGIEIVVPRQNNLEEVRFQATPEKLTVHRKLLLGELKDEIKTQEFLKLYVDATEGLQTDLSALVIEYVDESDQRHSMRLLSDLTHSEQCWIAAELREHGPSEREEEPAAPKVSRFRFSIVQILFITTLAAVGAACYSLGGVWGWLYALQLIAIILCLAAISGARSLGPFARRSWSKNEMVGASLVLGFLWVIRLIAFLSSK